jgi:hypothetical protein
MIKVISSVETYFMKPVFILLAFLLLNAIAFGQDNEDRPVTEGVTKITFIEPGIAHEFPLGTSTSFFLRGGMTVSLALDYYDEIAGILFRPFVAGSFRVYYNFRKRGLLEKNTAKNSANYFALLAIYATPPLNKSMEYRPVYNAALLNTGVVWGMQRNYPSGFSLDLNIGMGYVKEGSTLLISPVGELNIGWWFGKKNRNRR